MFKSSSFDDFPFLTFPTHNNLQHSLCFPQTYISITQQTSHHSQLHLTTTVTTTMAIPDNVYAVVDTGGIVEVYTVKSMAEAAAEKHSGSQVEEHKLMYRPRQPQHVHL